MSTVRFERFMSSNLEYLKCFSAGTGVGEGSEEHLKLSKKVLTAMAKQLHFVKSVDSTTAKRWVDSVTSSMLTTDDKRDLLKHLNDKVDLEEPVDNHNPGGNPSSVSGGVVPALQTTLATAVKKTHKNGIDHKFIHNYGYEKLWGLICDRTVSIDIKLQLMTLFLSQLGLRFPSEKTAAAATSLCRHFTVLHDDSPDKALASQRKLKEMLRVLWADKPSCDTPAEYPETPEEFCQMHPLWYRTAYEDNGPPVPSPVHFQEALMIYDQQPCRSTKKGCSPRPGADMHHFATYGRTPSQPFQQRMHQLQRGPSYDDVSAGQPPGVPAALPWLSICTPQGKVALPHTSTPYASPMAGGVLMLDVNAGVGAVAVAPPAAPDAAAQAPAAAVTPGLVNGLPALTDRDEQPKPKEKKPNMGDVATKIREKMNADKLAANDRLDAVKKKDAVLLKKREEKEAVAREKEAAKAAAQKTVAVTGKAKAAQTKLVKVVAAKAAPKAAAKAAAKAVAKAVPKSGYCPNDSLVYRGPGYHKVRYYKDSTVYHDAINHKWRVKPCTGSRKTIGKCFKTNPKQAWEEVVKILRKLNP